LVSVPQIVEGGDIPSNKKLQRPGHLESVRP
jgi:hypothetical protein